MAILTPSTFTWTLVGLYLIYLVTQDESVATWLVLQTKRLSTELSRRWYMLRFNPDSPWVRFEVERNAKKMAEDLIKEYENK